jgi:hypothetical protein
MGSIPRAHTEFHPLYRPLRLYQLLRISTEPNDPIQEHIEREWVENENIENGKSSQLKPTDQFVTPPTGCFTADNL